jgi:hypothetical protein
MRRCRFLGRFNPDQLGLNPKDIAAGWLKGPVASTRAAKADKKKEQQVRKARDEALGCWRAKKAAMIVERTARRAAKRAAEADRQKKQEKMASLKAMRPARLCRQGEGP